MKRIRLIHKWGRKDKKSNKIRVTFQVIYRDYRGKGGTKAKKTTITATTAAAVTTPTTKKIKRMLNKIELN